jgi:hypothetical protein
MAVVTGAVVDERVRHAALLAAQYRRYGGLAGLAITAGWHGVFDLSGTLAGLGAYRSPAVAVGCWCLYTVTGVVYGALLLRGRRRGRPWAGVVIVLAVSAAVLLACPADGLITPANWGWGSVGWLAVVVLWDRPLRELTAVLAANAVVMLTGMVARGVTDRTSLAAYLMVIVGSGTLQLGFGGGARLLTAAGRWVAEQAAEQTARVVDRARADAVHGARLELGRSVHEDTLPLLRELADGADPADPVIRHRSAVGAARLRRLLLETREGVQPLTVDLRSSADLAARAGIVVDLELHGTVPPLAEPVRRALTEPALAAVAAARHRARVTVTAVEGEVVVSVLSDARDGDVPVATGGAGSGAGTGVTAGPPGPDEVTVSRYDMGEGLWIESRWTRE